MLTKAHGLKCKANKNPYDITHQNRAIKVKPKQEKNEMDLNCKDERKKNKRYSNFTLRTAHIYTERSRREDETKKKKTQAATFKLRCIRK